MDTNNSETNHLAAVPADLLQRNSHVKVIGLKYSAGLRMRTDWLQASAGLVCKTIDSMEPNANSRPSGDLRRVIFGSDKGGSETTVSDSTTSEPVKR
jgi:hypothetical protein